MEEEGYVLQVTWSLALGKFLFGGTYRNILRKLTSVCSILRKGNNIMALIM